MGMYTGMRCKARIKPEYHALVREFMAICRVYNKTEDARAAFKQMVHDYPFLSDLAACDRGTYILSWMTAYGYDGNSEEWEEGDPDWELSFEGGLLRFQCSIKNYGNEYEKWAKVLDEIASEIITLQKWYEEDDAPATYLGRGEWHLPEQNRDY